MKKSILTLILILGLASNALAYDFSPLRQSLQRHLHKSQGPKPHLALLFETKDRQKLSPNHNLWLVKKEFSEELAYTFLVANPVLTEELRKKEKLSVESIVKDQEKLKGFLRLNGSDLLVLTTLSEEKGLLQLETQLLNPSSKEAASMTMTFSREGDLTNSYARITPGALKSTITADFTETLKEGLSEVGETLTDSADGIAGDLADNLTKKFLNPDHNEAWVDFNMTGWVIPTTYAVSTDIWIKNIKDVDMVASRVRFDWRVIQTLQVGAEVNGNETGGMHSAYLYVKFPFWASGGSSVAGGLRKRAYWNDNNLEFASEEVDPDINEKNDKRNQTALYIAGSHLLENPGIYLNAYLDNQRFGFGGKYLITDEIKAFLDSTYNHYDEALVTSDSAIGIQFYHPVGSIVTLSYHAQSEQTLFGVTFSF